MAIKDATVYSLMWIFANFVASLTLLIYFMNSLPGKKTLEVSAIGNLVEEWPNQAIYL